MDTSTVTLPLQPVAVTLPGDTGQADGTGDTSGFAEVLAAAMQAPVPAAAVLPNLSAIPGPAPVSPTVTAVPPGAVKPDLPAVSVSPDLLPVPAAPERVEANPVRSIPSDPNAIGGNIDLPAPTAAAGPTPGTPLAVELSTDPSSHTRVTLADRLFAQPLETKPPIESAGFSSSNPDVLPTGPLPTEAPPTKALSVKALPTEASPAETLPAPGTVVTATRRENFVATELLARQAIAPQRAEADRESNALDPASNGKAEDSRSPLPELTTLSRLPSVTTLRPNAPASPATQIAQAIIEHGHLTRHTDTVDFRIRLDPPDLGTVEVHLRAKGDTVMARLIVAEDAARHVLADQLPALRDRLAEAGVRVSELDVTTGGSNLPDRRPQPQPRWDLEVPVIPEASRRKFQPDGGPRARPEVGSSGLDLLV
jgi:hypothetical protein